MKKVGKIFIWCILALIIVVDLFLTIYLLKYNKYNVSQFGKYSFIIIDENLDNFKKGDLVIVRKNDNSEIKIGDYVFFYDIKSKENIVNYGKVNETKKVTDKESTFKMSGEYSLSSEYVIGKAETSKVFHTLGTVLAVLSSRIGFLLLIIFPILVVFVYQIYLLIMELQNNKKN